MYFPNDPHHPQLSQHIESAMAQCQALQPAVKAYALVDACLEKTWAHELWQRSQAQPEQVQSLYQGTSLAAFEETAPFLCTLERAEIGAWLARTRSWPGLSFIQSALDLGELQAHLSRFTSARTADGLRLPARWGFPLAVPLLIGALAFGARELLLSGFAAWHLINRAGALETVVGQPTAPPMSGPVDGLSEDGFELSDQALARVVDEVEVDAMVIAEVERTPALAKSRRGSDLHRLARRALKEMDHLGVEGASERRRLLRVALASDSEAAALSRIAAQKGGANHV